MTRDVTDSVIEAQAVALSAKNVEIKSLETQLKSARDEIENLQRKVDLGLYQNLIDQIQEDVLRAVDEAFSGKMTTIHPNLANEGDFIIIRDDSVEPLKQRLVTLRRIIVSGDVEIRSTAMTRDLRLRVDRLIKQFTDKLIPLGDKLMLCRQPRPFPGTGAMVSTYAPENGCRAIVSYAPNSLCNHLYLDILVGEIEACEPS